MGKGADGRGRRRSRSEHRGGHHDRGGFRNGQRYVQPQPAQSKLSAKQLLDGLMGLKTESDAEQQLASIVRALPAGSGHDGRPMAAVGSDGFALPAGMSMPGGTSAAPSTAASWFGDMIATMHSMCSGSGSVPHARLPSPPRCSAPPARTKDKDDERKELQAELDALKEQNQERELQNMRREIEDLRRAAEARREQQANSEPASEIEKLRSEAARLKELLAAAQVAPAPEDEPATGAVDPKDATEIDWLNGNINVTVEAYKEFAKAVMPDMVVRMKKAVGLDVWKGREAPKFDAAALGAFLKQHGLKESAHPRAAPELLEKAFYVHFKAKPAAVRS